MGTLILLLMMAGFMAGVCLGEWRELVEVERDEVERREHHAWTAAFAATAELTDLTFPVVPVPSGEPETARAAA